MQNETTVNAAWGWRYKETETERERERFAEALRSRVVQDQRRKEAILCVLCVLYYICTTVNNTYVYAQQFASSNRIETMRIEEDNNIGDLISLSHGFSVCQLTSDSKNKTTNKKRSFRQQGI